MSYIKLEYVWLDGYTPEPNLRSKVKVLSGKDVEDFYNAGDEALKICPEWSFDGSSTRQAPGDRSDCILKPVRLYFNPFEQYGESYFVLCEVLDKDGNPHESNTRSKLGDEDADVWFGFEQEYTLMEDGRPVGFPKGGYPEPQGKYYCGVGSKVVNNRQFADAHMSACIAAGIDITGTNAEVLLGQWEYQVFGKGKIKAADDLWMSRYFLHRMSEGQGFHVEFHPKPIKGDWNGSGLHCNFSNKIMREDGDKAYYDSLFDVLKERQKEHIEAYGSDNHERLTGEHETQSIDKFSYGVSDRGASIRIPITTAKDWNGYLEDRRPASHADPYNITRVISSSLDSAMKTRSFYEETAPTQ